MLFFRCSRLYPVLCVLAVNVHPGATIGIFNRRYGNHSRMPAEKTKMETLHLSDMLQKGSTVEEIRKASEVHIGGRTTYSGFFNVSSVSLLHLCDFHS